MICGTGSFKHIDDDPWSAPSSPKSSKAPSSPRTPKKKASKNPYSTRGLEKYSTVVSELEARRAKIMEKVGPEGSSLVWFMYSNANEWTPIVVKLDEDKRPSNAKRPQAQSPPRLTAPAKEASPPPPPPKEDVEAVPDRKTKKKSFSWREWIKPRYYWLLVLVLILACLLMFGKMFAICCTSIWWYLVPVMQGDESTSARRSTFKKDYQRRLSNVRMSGNLMPSSPAKRLAGGGGGVHETPPGLKRKR